MRVQVLVPCLEKTKEQLIGLCEFLNIQSDALFLNQTGQTREYSFEFGNHRVSVVETSWRGVSRARNELIKRCDADVGLFIDDDCVLADGYADRITEAFVDLPKADAIRFNTKRDYWNPVNAHAAQQKKARFRDLSSFGMWGLAFKAAAFRKRGILFDEGLGAPNYLYNGEDSVFLYDLCKKTKHVYLNPFYVCDVKETKESTWFSSYGKQYFVTKGFVYSHLYHNFWWLALRRMYMKYGKEYGVPYNEVRRYAKIGRVMYKTNSYEEPDGE